MSAVGGARFEGKVLFATGGASGLARAVARRFTAEGGRVAVVDRDLGNAQAVAAELDGAIAIEVDVADEGAVTDAVHAAHDSSGRSTACSTPPAMPSSGRSRNGRSTGGSG